MFKKILTISILTVSALMVLPVLANTTTNTVGMSKITATQIACVGAAVTIREAVVGAAFNTYTQTIQAAYSARATALQQAYTASNGKDVRTAVRAAWNAFNSTRKTVNQAWRASRNTAWTQFRTAVKDCKTPASITDTGSAVSEIMGQ